MSLEEHPTIMMSTLANFPFTIQNYRAFIKQDPSNFSSVFSTGAYGRRSSFFRKISKARAPSVRFKQNCAVYHSKPIPVVTSHES